MIGGAVVFGFGRPSQTQTQQLLSELGQSYGHFKQAAGHAAGGAAEKVTPAYDRARNVAVRSWTATRSTFHPMYEQVRVGAANARKGRQPVNRKHRWPMVFGLLAAGAAVGATGALVAKRRRSAMAWDDYDNVPVVDDTGLTETERQPFADERSQSSG